MQESIGGFIAAFGLWLVFGAIGMSIAQKKGRPWAGFFLGLFLGPIGWLFAGLGLDSRFKCTECLGAVPAAARRCRHCGIAFEQPFAKPFQPRCKHNAKRLKRFSTN